MTDIISDLRRNVADAEYHALMYAPPLRTEDVRTLLAIVDALESDKRSLARIVDDLSAQVNALNQTLQGVVMAQNAELLDQLGDALAYINEQDTQPHVECFGCGSREVLVTGRGDLAGRAMFNLQCTVCGRQWSQIVDYVETVTEGNGIEVHGE